MKKIGLKELFDHGLLFEINRSFLHPLGYSMSYKPSSGTEDADSLILQKTNDAEGVLYDEKNFMEGASKFSVFMKNIGNDIIKRRLDVKGFIRQTRSDQ